MTSTICTTLEPSFSHVMDYARKSNMASYPLPSIPRRIFSPRRTHGHSISEPSLASIMGATATAKLVAYAPTPHPAIALVASPQRVEETSSLSDSDLSSSSTPLEESQPTIILRSKRSRGQRSTPQGPLEQYSLPPPPTRSKPKPKPSKLEPQDQGRIVRPSLGQGEPSDNETPRPLPSNSEGRGSRSDAAKLGINSESVPIRHVSESHVGALVGSHSLPVPPTTVSVILPSEARLLRKKSGEPIKSSLKSAKCPGLSVVTKPSSSKSEPSTPTQSKAVHFDSQLEHVKLFLAEQKPLAVSRDSSPTDTSGTDNDFPEFIYGQSSDEEMTRKNLVMQVTNMPKKRSAGVDVALQELTLSQDSASIHGRVKVKNIAFEKRLAVRFTFDWWQTTCEVTAKYIESLEHDTFDIFGFTIRLNDIMARIEEKTLFLALRYTVVGREIWDNNGGKNYLARFTKSTVQSQRATSKGKDVSIGSAMTHLKNQLEQVAQGRENGVSFLAQRVHRQAGREADKSLSSRYDFSVSPTPPTHPRANTYPSSSNTIPWPHKTSPVPTKNFDLPSRSPRTSSLGSPTLHDIVARPPTSAIDDAPFCLPPPRRNHQRGYFEKSLPEFSGIKMTPPGTPRTLSPADSAVSTPATSPSQLFRFHWFPPGDSSRKSPPYGAAPVTTSAPIWTTTQHEPSTGSNDSTPSISSPSSSSTTSPSLSPTEEFKHAAMSRELSLESPSSYKGHDNYSSFLNRFCFYTGASADYPLNAPMADIPRSHSASSVEEFLFQSPPTEAFSPSYSVPFITPTHRSPSFDELGYRSGSSTPTASNMSLPSPVHLRPF